VGVLVAGAPSRHSVEPLSGDTAVVEAAAIDSAVPTRTARANMTAGRRSGEVGVRVVQSRNAPPVRDREEIRRHLVQGQGGTYMGDILAAQDSELVRWPENTILHVWIQPGTTATNWSPSYVDMVRTAFNTWAAAGAPIGVDFVNDSATAGVHVMWIDRFAAGAAIGQTQQTWDQYRWLVGGEITLATHSVEGYELNAPLVRAAALHEIGHLLGVGHSGSNGDIMSAEAHALELSHADLLTLRLLYILPPGSAR
jgi:predicted Zn-dependent protease